MPGWIDGPPTTPNKHGYICEFESGSIWRANVFLPEGKVKCPDGHTAFQASRIIRHMPYEPLPLPRRFRCKVSNQRGHGVVFPNGKCCVSWDTVYQQTRIYDFNEFVTDYAEITEWLDGGDE